MIAVSLVLLFLFIREALYMWLCYQNIPRMTNRFGLWRHDFFDTRFRNILHAFLSGNNMALNPLLRMREVRVRLNGQFKRFYRGFAYEGAGMGLGARATMHAFQKGQAFETYIHKLDPNHIYQYYVGLGWWLQIRYKFRAAGYERWIKELDPYYASIVFDGVGFKAGLFDYRKNPGITDRFTGFHPSDQRVCCQGFGRSLWFLNRFEIGPVLAEMDPFPSHWKKDIFSGIGLAVAYSMFDNEKAMAYAYDRIPDEVRDAFAQGMAFGWEARRLQHREYWDEMLAKFTPDWKGKMESWVDTVHKARALAETSDSKTHYVRWMDATRSMLRNQIAEEGN